MPWWSSAHRARWVQGEYDRPTRMGRGMRQCTSGRLLLLRVRLVGRGLVGRGRLQRALERAGHADLCDLERVLITVAHRAHDLVGAARAHRLEQVTHELVG